MNKNKSSTSTKQQTNAKTQRNRARRQRRNAKKRVTKAEVLMDRAVIAKCTKEYAAALVNPFGARATLPCIPDNIVLPSFKLQAKARGVFSTGTLGIGWISLDPWKMLINDPTTLAASTGYPIMCTGATYASNVYDSTIVLGVPQPGVTLVAGNSILTYANMQIDTPLKEFRLVAAGLRISYVGSTFRNQGRVTLYKSQQNRDIPVGIDSAGLLHDNYTVMVPVSRKSEYIFYTPDTQDLLSYAPYSDFLPSTGGVDRRCLLAFIDGGDTTVPQSWSFEAVAYFEVTGPNLTLSPSHSDVQGLGHVLESLPVKNPTASPAATEQSVMNRIASSLREQFGTFAVNAASAGASFALNQASRYMMGGVPAYGFGNALPSITEVD